MKGKKKDKPDVPQIYTIKKGKRGISFSRKDFLRTLGAVSGSTVFSQMVNGCKEEEESEALYKSIHTMNHDSIVTKVSFSPDSKILASGSINKEIKLWSIPEGNPLQTNEEIRGSTVFFNPDGKSLVSSDNEIRIYSIPDGYFLKTIVSEKSSILINGFNSDGKILVSGYNYRIKFWSIPDGQLLNSVYHNTGFSDMCFSPDGKLLATLSEGATALVRILTVPEGNEIKSINFSYENIISNDSVMFSPDGKSLVIVSRGSSSIIYYWSLTENKLLKSIVDTSGFFHNACFSPDGNTIAAIYNNFDEDYYAIRLWSVPNFKLVKTLIGHTSPIYSITFSSDSKMLASGGVDRTVKLWSLPEGKSIIPVLCTCDKVCTCNEVSPGNSNDVCTCNTIESCTCNKVCSCNNICSCNNVCTCNTVCSCVSHSSSYWYPN
jgi:WD40 repeat protein